MELNIQGHGNLVLVHHNIRHLEHGGQIAVQIDHAAGTAWERHECKIIQVSELFQQPSDCGAGEAPPLGQIGVIQQRVTCTVAEIDHRANLRAKHLVVFIDGGEPQIQYHVHLRRLAIADQLRSDGNGHKEEAAFLLAGAVVIQHRVVFAPALDAVLDQVAVAQLGKGNKLPVLEGLQDGQGLMLEPDTKANRQLTDPADPLAWIDGVSDAVQPAVGGSEIGIGAEDGIIKKTGASVGSDAPVSDQGLNKFSVDAAAWVIHDLFDFKLIVWHI